MKKEEVKSLIEKIVNEKVQLLLNRIDTFQSNVFKNIEKLKDFDELVDFSMPDDLTDRDADAAGEIAVLNDFVKKIAAATNQLVLIGSIIDGINQFCDRAAIFLLRDDKLVGWKGKGFSGHDGQINDEDLKKVFFSLSANTIFKNVIETKKTYLGEPTSKPDDFLIYNRFGGGKPQAVIYADSLVDTLINHKVIEILATVGELSLDMLPIRQKVLTKIKTQEFVEEPELEVKFIEHTDELEKTSAPAKGNDPERYARVIINDIILYNKKVVDDGIKNKNLYEVLKETLLQAKELYMRRSSDLRYFEEQMVKILAKGDRQVLKGYNFEVYR
jgi:hypothetical protein